LIRGDIGSDEAGRKVVGRMRAGAASDRICGAGILGDRQTEEGFEERDNLAGISMHRK